MIRLLRMCWMISKAIVVDAWEQSEKPLYQDGGYDPERWRKKLWQYEEARHRK